MSSSRPSDTRLDRLAEDLPTTAEDVAALDRARERRGRCWWEELEAINRLVESIRPEPRPRRPTAAGREPFEL